MFKKVWFIVFMCTGSVLFGQDHTVNQDTTTRDSTSIYDKIQQYSEQSKVTKVLHKWIFSRPNPAYKAPTRDTIDYSTYNGKVIRKISIKAYDPFGYSLNNTLQQPEYWYEKWGNALHVRSQRMAIKKFFLFKLGEGLDSLRIRETARLLRQQAYIRRVKIVPQAVKGTKDSVDLVVKVLDSWSLIPDASFSGNKMRIGLQDRNFIGTGHRVDLDYSKRFADGESGFSSIYHIPNFKNTFIDVTGKYAFDFDGYNDKYISIQRTFYSPLTRWAGGVFIQNRSLERPIQIDTLALDYNYYDFWGAYAIPLKQQASAVTNLVFSARSYFLNYNQQFDLQHDSTGYFSNENFYLTSVGLSRMRFKRDRYIFRDGEIEDVPIGSLYALTAGVQHKHQHDRLYLGLRASKGKYFNWGFVSANFEAGTFFDRGDLEETTLSFKLNYFSPLLQLAEGWKMRQFVKPQIVLGFNRQNSLLDRLSLNETPYYRGVNSYRYVDYESKRDYIDYNTGSITGFDGSATGTHKYVLNLQTQFYSPWNVIGFRLNPFLNISVGYLTGDSMSYNTNKLYSAFGVGFIIRNDYLVFDSFQISLSYYPSMPGVGNSIWDTNSVRTEDFGFQSFQMNEPHPVIYE